MLSKITGLPFVIFLVLGLTQTAAALTKPKLICATAKGDLVVRAKCRKAESVFSSDLLLQQTSQTLGGSFVGPIGEKGIKGITGERGVKGTRGLIDFSACRQVSGFSTNFLNPSNPAQSATLTCNSSLEFLFDDDFQITVLPGSVGTRVFAQARIPLDVVIAGDKRDYGATIYVSRDSTVGQGIYNLSVTGLCCPR